MYSAWTHTDIVPGERSLLTVFIIFPGCSYRIGPGERKQRLYQKCKQQKAHPAALVRQMSLRKRFNSSNEAL